MTHKILVPLDGSRLSEQAIPYAEALAKSTGSDLMFMRAVLTARLAPGGSTFSNEIHAQGREYLDMQVAEARKHGLRAERHLWEDEAGYSILQMVETHSPDFIVMSTHGRSGLSRVVWGSVADYVLHHTPVPMLLVPKVVDPRWSEMAHARFVVPLDGSALAEEALPSAENLARAFNGEIELIQAIEPNTWLIEAGDPWATYAFEPSVFEFEAQQKEAADKYLDSVANRLNRSGITVSVAVVPGRPAAVIREAVRDNQARAIVMATHGRGGPSRVLMGSVTDAVVRTAHVPVLVVRPSAVRHEALQKQPNTSTSERNLMLAMSQPELELTRIALQQVVSNSHGGANLVQAFDLLDRISQVQAPERPAVGVGR